MPARPGDDVLLRPARQGRMLLDIMWDDLLRCIDDLMHPDEFFDDDSGWDRKRTEGRAEGVAWCIAILTQSPRPIDIEIVKAEAMERWEAEQDG